MPSKETVCDVCDQQVGLINPYRGPNAHRGPLKRSPHVDPNLPKLPNGRRPRCAGSSIEVPDVLIYEVAYGHTRRKQMRARATS